MSLVCWLPLTGTLENKGISNITVTNNGATVDSAGKIGNCYAFNGSTGYISLVGTQLFQIFTGGSQQFSIAMWVYHADATRAILFGDYSTSGSINFNIELSAGHGVRFYWNGSPDTYPSNATVTASGWTHVALTYNGSLLQSYINGVVKGSWSGTLNAKNKTSGEFRLGRDNRSDSTAFNGKMNDFRVYDHCLSAAEVKEISQGLVLHYKLDGFQGGYGNPNLLPANDTTFFNTTRSFEFQGWVNNFYTTAWVNEHLTVGQQYTLSYTVTCISIPDTSIYSVSETRHSPILVHQGGGWSQVTTTNDGIKSTNLLPGQSRTYKCTFTFATATESQAYYGFCGYTCLYRNADRTSTAYARFRIDNLKLELGSDVTPWVPNINDESADIIHIQDSSGYGHNGTITGNPSIISTTPRYSFGMHLERTRINSSTGFPSGNNPNFTIAFWTKIFSNITYVSYGDLCGMYDNGQGGNTFRLELCGSPPGNNLMWFRGPSGQNGGGFNMNSNSSSGWFSKDTWHHVALVGDGINKKYYCYLDGQLCQTYNGSANSWTPTGQVYLGDTVEATADFSDFRIYCTALSADDIKQLYQVSAKVDDLGGLHTFEAVENLPNIIFKIDSARVAKVFQDGLSRYTQSNCQVTLTDNGYRIYRPPNLTTANDGNTMWGGLKLVNQTTDTISPYNSSRDNIWGLQKNHTYLFAFHAKGQSSNSPSLNVQSNMGWNAIAGIGPNPTYLVTNTIPSNFNGEKDCHIIFTITDDLVKTATETKGGYTSGSEYLSYRHLSLNYGYTSTGELGTDLYLTDFRLYDITNIMGQIKKNGQANFADFIERNGIAKIEKNAEFMTNNLIER